MHDRSKPPTLPCTIRNFDNGGCGALLIGLFAVPVVMAGARGIAGAVGQPVEPAVAAAAGLGAVMFLTMMFFFSTDSVTTVDREGIRITMQRRLGPLRGAVKTFLDARWAEVETVEDVTAVRIASKGGTQEHYHLKVGRVTIPNHMLGAGSRDGKYLELIEAIRAAIGDRLVARTDLGTLERAVREVARSELRKP